MGWDRAKRRLLSFDGLFAAITVERVHFAYRRARLPFFASAVRRSLFAVFALLSRSVMKTIKSILSIALAVGMLSLTTTAEAGQPMMKGGGMKGGMKGGGVHAYRGSRSSIRGGGVRTVGHGIDRVGGVGYGGYGRGWLGGIGGIGGFGYGGAAPYSIFGGGAFNGGQSYINGQIPIPPYFALHPPVYYSAPVPRSYGYSPYAYPGYAPTPPAPVLVEPEVVENQYCPAAVQKLEQKEKAGKATDDFAKQSQWIANPFVRNMDDEVIQKSPVVAAN